MGDHGDQRRGVTDLSADLARLSEEERRLREEIAEARRVLAIERAATRRPALQFGAVAWSAASFLSALLAGVLVRC
jgi:hypothetical protein